MSSDLQRLLSDRASKAKASELRELMKVIERPEMVSFAGGIPDPNLFPRELFAESYGRVIRDADGGKALQYASTEGYAPLRRWIAARLSQEGVECTSENILITNGSQQALDLIGKLLIDEGDRVGTFRPTYLGALQAFAAYQPEFSSLHDDAPLAGPIKLRYVVPDFANPSGETLSRDEREKLLAAARREGSVVVEDAAYSALRFDGEAVPPIAALDRVHSGSIENTRTLYCGTFSKTLSPGLRVGWVCGPRELVQRLILLKQGSDLHTSTINQMVALRVAEACFDDQVARLRAVYSSRRDAMLHALSKYAPATTSWIKPEGGLFIWVRLPKDVDASALFEKAIEQGLAFVPGAAFFPDRPERNTMRLSYSLNSEPVILEGMKRLFELVAVGAPRILTNV